MKKYGQYNPKTFEKNVFMIPDFNLEDLNKLKIKLDMKIKELDMGHSYYGIELAPYLKEIIHLLDSAYSVVSKLISELNEIDKNLKRF